VLLLAALACAQSPQQLADLSLEELGLIQVTSVSRQAEPLLDAPAAVYVITRDDILRSGVTSIPEALRLAPGVEVARRSANAWSISIRGFNSDLANKLLVLIDGRSVYSPLYAGVFWDVQDTLLEDIERIEVVSGPGGTLWGANAVNGVINIITRSTNDTRAPFVELGGGTEEQGFAGFRYGGNLNERFAFRTYLKYFDRDASKQLSGNDGIDDWRMARGGFRIDSKALLADRIRIQGDIYSGEKVVEFIDAFTIGTLPAGVSVGDVDMSGGNVMAEWQRIINDSSDFKLLFYYDHTYRSIPNTYTETRDTLDLDFQHHFSIGTRNDVLWGAGIRYTTDELENSTFSSFEPPSRSDSTYSLFVQDKIGIARDRVYLTLGSKFEHNDYSGYEVQPNVRLSWHASDHQTAWFAASRAVRIPSRLDADLRLTVPISVPTIPFPVYVQINGNHDVESEELLAYEGGYRIQASDAVYLDLAVFYNDYDRLQTTEPGLPVFVIPSYIILPNDLMNNMYGDSHGGTAAISWQPADIWRLRLHYAYFDLQLQTRPESLDPSAPNIAGNSPKHLASLFSYLDLFEDFNVYLAVRYVDELPNQGVDAYTAVDLSIRWRVADHWHVTMTGQNLTDSGHAEFGPDLNEMERAAFLKIAWSP
jgi:iron complex outermembrane receptor protein